jgi:small subunit ribosomal protein S7
MSRRKKTYKREVIPDPVFKDVVVAKFVNKMMYDGKKETAQKLFYGALKELEGKIPNEEPINILKKALENTKPALEVRSRRVGGATYQVPVDVRPSRRLALAMRWLIAYSRERGEKDYAKRLAAELLDAYNTITGSF